MAVVPELTAAPSINDARTQALLTLIERLGEIDLTPLLVYRFDSVPASALSFLAWQFDVLSPLWQLVAPVALSIDALTDIDSLTDIDLLTGPDDVVLNATVAAERELLKEAIPLHRFRGTPFAIKQALASLGWTSVSLLEGQGQWGGTQYPSNQGWAVFRVMINLAAGQPVESVAADTIVAAVNFFKPARAWLDSLWFVTPPVLDGAPVPSDLLAMGGVPGYQADAAPAPSDAALSLHVAEPALPDPFGLIAPLYNAHYCHSGITYGANEPIVADPALILNGVAVLYGG